MTYYLSSEAAVVLSCEGFEIGSFDFETCGGQEEAEQEARNLIDLLSGE